MKPLDLDTTAVTSTAQPDLHAWLVSKVACAADLPEADVGLECSFESLGLDSVDHYTIAGELAEYLDRDIPSSLLFDCKSIAATAAALQDTDLSVPNCCVELGSGEPGDHMLFMVHSIAGDLGDLQELAQAVDGFRVIGIQQSFDGRNSDGDVTLEELAERYVAALIQLQPDGAFNLVGHSYGSRLAFEVACQLQRNGRQIACLAILDGWPVPRRRATTIEALRAVPAFLRNLPRWVRDDLLAGEQGRLGDRLIRKVRARVKGNEHLDLSDHFKTESLTEKVHRRKEGNLRSWARYRPGILEGDLHLYRARTRPLCHSLLNRSGDWESYVQGQVHVHDAQGHHTNMIRGQRAKQLAAQLASQIGLGR